MDENEEEQEKTEKGEDDGKKGRRNTGTRKAQNRGSRRKQETLQTLVVIIICWVLFLGGAFWTRESGLNKMTRDQHKWNCVGDRIVQGKWMRRRHMRNRQMRGGKFGWKGSLQEFVIVRGLVFIA